MIWIQLCTWLRVRWWSDISNCSDVSSMYLYMLTAEVAFNEECLDSFLSGNNLGKLVKGVISTSKTSWRFKILIHNNILRKYCVVKRSNSRLEFHCSLESGFRPSREEGSFSEQRLVIELTQLVIITSDTMVYAGANFVMTWVCAFSRSASSWLMGDVNNHESE